MKRSKNCTNTLGTNSKLLMWTVPAFCLLVGKLQMPPRSREKHLRRDSAHWQSRVSTVFDRRRFRRTTRHSGRRAVEAFWRSWDTSLGWDHLKSGLATRLSCWRMLLIHPNLGTASLKKRLRVQTWCLKYLITNSWSTM